ncbi:tetratricopeptide TPR_2 repeat protein [Shewanella sediminis HAW-EB3]|uniref:Tetratricopeptide TPR_2 repeat protein n=1 Tax=Shewanella sediminis (strain HAW-EB3) TaxID=425104 RepID=A8FWZ4_SHESH|nr:hypothetical protein [Shewanella sediminis]ABV37367.1 tetratricopeptide TPR_2 repeat protein [Shewanella sediminis HAW-EB3]
MKRIFHRVVPAIAALMLMTACSSHISSVSSATPVMPQMNDNLFVSGSDVTSTPIPGFERLMALTPEQIEDLHQFVSRDDIAQLPKNKQVREYLFTKLVNFNYEGENYSASVALEKGSGNCMTLALLTYAVARELGVKAVFQVMHTPPMLLEVTSDLAVTSDHVRTFLYEDDTDNKGFYFSGRTYVILDYFPDRYDRGGRKIGEQQFIGMLYRNFAADALLDGDLNRAFSLLKTGTQYTQEYAPLLNMLAIIHRRAGDDETAKEFYRYALNVSESKITLLSNYHYLLTLNGEVEAAHRVKLQLLALEDSSPYSWYVMGKEALDEGDNQSAKIYLKKFLQNTPYYHRAYFDLAKAQYALGESVAARSSLSQALSYAELPESQRQYQAKLAWLNQ